MMCAYKIRCGKEMFEVGLATRSAILTDHVNKEQCQMYALLITVGEIRPLMSM
jgi:hypothetical protein